MFVEKSDSSDSPPEQGVPTSRFRDRVRLVGAAMLVCAIMGAAFLAAEIYHIGVACVFFAGNSLVMFLILRKAFRKQFKNPRFIAFAVLWMAAHGAVVVLLMRAGIQMLYWPFFFLLELFAGFLLANLLFDVLPDRS